jgi:hypothetical protein
VFHAAFPRSFEGVAELRTLPVNHFCEPDEAAGRIEVYARFIEQGFELCSEQDLRRMLPTVFATESVMTLLLGNLEHLINHKYQLFVYLKLLGVSVGTGDIYCWRGSAGDAPT